MCHGTIETSTSEHAGRHRTQTIEAINGPGYRTNIGNGRQTNTRSVLAPTVHETPHTTKKHGTTGGMHFSDVDSTAKLTT
jgi:hypothetical protein